MAGMARAIGATSREAQKMLFFPLQYFERLFCARFNHKLQSCINSARPYLMY